MASRSTVPLRLDERPVALIYRSPLFNPSETFVQAHAAGLTRYQPLLVGLEDKGNAWPKLRDRILTPRSEEEALRFKLLGQARVFASQLAGFTPRLVHAHFATDGLLALPLARSLGVPLVTTLHGYDVGRTRPRLLASGRISWVKYALFRRRLMAQGDLFLAVSDAVRNEAVAIGYPKERTHTHYLGVDLDRFRPDGRDAEPGLILHVGRLVEKKGTRLLLFALARARTTCPEARLLIVGDGPERPALERPRRRSRTRRRRPLRPAHSPRTKSPTGMCRAWLLAVPSVTAFDGDAEGLPTVILEAAALALPTIGSNHKGIPEAIADGRTGFIVPEREAEALAARIVELLGSAELRGRMGAAARTLAEEKFDARAPERHARSALR
jgi:glycosyltransferase involved in cell wall biosynthesis